MNAMKMDAKTKFRKNDNNNSSSSVFTLIFHRGI